MVLAVQYSAFEGETKEFSQKRLQRAVSHVNSLWFPPNGDTLAKVRSGLKDGRYELGIGFLVEDLKSDIALLTYCIRESARVLKLQNRPKSLSNLEEFFQHVGLETLDQVLRVDSNSISRHAGGAASELSVAQLQATMLGACASETLAEKRDLNRNFAFLGSILRQIGLLLVSWNYPSVFEKAISNAADNDDLEQQLRENLGFSAEALALAMMREWGCGPELRYIVAGQEGLDSTEKVNIGKEQEALQHFVELCHVGEALARANDPQHFPSAEQDWSEARTVLEDVLGKDGLRLVQQKVGEYCIAYRKQFPELFDTVDPEGRLYKSSEQAIAGSNPYISQTDLQLRPHIKSMYGKLSSLGSPRERVAFFLDSVCPKSGFDGGVVSTFDPNAKSIIPRARFGAVQPERLFPVSTAHGAAQGEVIACAFECASPIVVRDGNVVSIASSFGGQSRVGVFYVEISTSQFDQDPGIYLLHFKALRKALEDCLGLSDISISGREASKKNSLPA